MTLSIAKKIVNSDSCGVIVARFQSHSLHQGHTDLIDTVLSRHPRVFIFLGLSPLKNTLRNPLPFKDRKSMIEERYGNRVEIFHIDDNRDDQKWSNNLDAQVNKWLNPEQTAVMYGSRDSFIKHYLGKFETCELEPEIFISATEIRKKIINNHPSSEDYRAGLIVAPALRFPVVYQTVDVAVHDGRGKFLMAKKPNESKWRFIGGFSDPNSLSLESDARREVSEEVSIEISDPVYIGSSIINDWRYVSEKDTIKTAFFIAKHLYGNPEANDDIAFVKWLNSSEMTNNNLMEEHHILLAMLKDKRSDCFM